MLPRTPRIGATFPSAPGSGAPDGVLGVSAMNAPKSKSATCGSRSTAWRSSFSPQTCTFSGRL